jgi:hypothetical protein
VFVVVAADEELVETSATSIVEEDEGASVDEEDIVAVGGF